MQNIILIKCPSGLELPTKILVGGVSCFLKSFPFFRPKYVIYNTLFET